MSQGTVPCGSNPGHQPLCTSDKHGQLGSDSVRSRPPVARIAASRGERRGLQKERRQRALANPLLGRHFLRCYPTATSDPAWRTSFGAGARAFDMAVTARLMRGCWLRKRRSAAALIFCPPSPAQRSTAAASLSHGSGAQGNCPADPSNWPARSPSTRHRSSSGSPTWRRASLPLI